MAVANYIANGRLSIPQEPALQGGFVIEFLATSPRLLSRGPRAKFKSAPVDGYAQSIFLVELAFAKHFPSNPRLVQLRVRVPKPGGKDLKSCAVPVHLPAAGSCRDAAGYEGQTHCQELALVLKADGRTVEAKVTVQLQVQHEGFVQSSAAVHGSAATAAAATAGFVAAAGCSTATTQGGGSSSTGAEASTGQASAQEQGGAACDASVLWGVERMSCGSDTAVMAAVGVRGRAAEAHAAPAVNGAEPCADAHGLSTSNSKDCGNGSGDGSMPGPSVAALQQPPQQQQRQQPKKRPWWSLSQLFGSLSGRGGSKDRDGFPTTSGNSASVGARAIDKGSGGAALEPGATPAGAGQAAAFAAGAGRQGEAAQAAALGGGDVMEGSFHSSCPYLALGPTAVDAAAVSAAGPRVLGSGRQAAPTLLGSVQGDAPAHGHQRSPARGSGNGVAALAVSAAAGERASVGGVVAALGSFGGSARSYGAADPDGILGAVQPLLTRHSHQQPRLLERGSGGGGIGRSGSGIGRFGGPGSAPASSCSSRAGSQDGSSPLYKKGGSQDGSSPLHKKARMNSGPLGLASFWPLGRHAKAVVPLSGTGSPGSATAAAAGSAGPLGAAQGLPPLPPRPHSFARNGMSASDRGSGIGQDANGALAQNASGSLAQANESGTGPGAAAGPGPGAAAGPGPGAGQAPGEWGGMNFAQLAFAGLLPAAAATRTSSLPPHPPSLAPRPPAAAAAPRTPGRPRSMSGRRSLEVALHGGAALEGRGSVRDSAPTPPHAAVDCGAAAAAAASALEEARGSCTNEPGLALKPCALAAGAAVDGCGAAGGAAGGATTDATTDDGRVTAQIHCNGGQSLSQVPLEVSAPGEPARGDQGRSAVAAAADAAVSCDPATAATASVACCQGQGQLLDLPAMPGHLERAGSGAAAPMHVSGPSLELSGVDVAGAAATAATAATAAAGAVAADAAAAATPNGDAPPSSGNGAGISSALRQEIANIIQSLDQQLNGVGPSVVPNISPRRFEFKESLEALLQSEQADESVARATLDSVMQEITPFDKGKSLGDGWYSKDLPVRDPAAPDGSGGLKRINSCPGIAEGMAGGAGAAGAGVAPAQKSGFVAAVARALRGAHRHTQSAAVPSSLDVVPLSVAVQALYAPVDQVSERGESACTCIALEVAAWLEQHPCQPGPGRSCRLASPTLADLVKRGCSLWRNTCWPGAEAGQGAGAVAWGNGTGIPGQTGAAEEVGAAENAEGTGTGTEAGTGAVSGAAADNLLGFHAALEARNERLQHPQHLQHQSDRQGATRPPGKPPLPVGASSRPGSQPGTGNTCNTSNTSNSRLYEAASAYSQVGPRGMSDPATTLPAFCKAAVEAASTSGTSLTYVLVASGHSTVASFLPDGRVVYVNSLGRSLGPSCRHAHALEFRSAADFCAAYVGLTAPAGPEPAQVEAHRVALEPLHGREPEIQLFMPQC